MSYFGSLISSILVVGLISGCSSLSHEQKYGTVGGIAGAGMGALVGGAIGAGLKNGKITESVLLGTGIGLPVGILLGVGIARLETGAEIMINDHHIRGTQAELDQGRYEIEQERNRLLDDATEVGFVNASEKYQYHGATLGQAPSGR
jgi:hypothetical protein